MARPRGLLLVGPPMPGAATGSTIGGYKITLTVRVHGSWERQAHPGWLMSLVLCWKFVSKSQQGKWDFVCFVSNIFCKIFCCPPLPSPPPWQWLIHLTHVAHPTPCAIVGSGHSLTLPGYSGKSVWRHTHTRTSWSQKKFLQSLIIAVWIFSQFCYF